MSILLRDAMPVALSNGSPTQTLNEILHEAYGDMADSIQDLQILYYNQDYMKSFNPDLGYWDPANSYLTRVLYYGSPIASTSNSSDPKWFFVDKSNFDNVTFDTGNNITSNIHILITMGGDQNNLVKQDISLTTVPSDLPVNEDGMPTPGDVVAMANRVQSVYGSTPNANDCHGIASDIAAAAGATLDANTGALDPTQNEEGGFWRIAYRGSDAGAMSNWQSLVQPGDIVRMAWTAAPNVGHTTTVVAGPNANGQILVLDNGGGVIGEHWVNYDDYTVASSVTIYRLAADHTYLINGSDLSDALHGTVVNDRLAGGLGADALFGGDGSDTADYGHAKAMVGADLMWAPLNLGEAAGDTYHSIENLQGSAFGDNLNGDNVANVIWGGRGNDQMSGRGGNDTIDGGEDIDTAYYSGKRSEYAISMPDIRFAHSNFTISDKVEGRDGTDRVLNVEYLHFDDGTFSVADLFGNQVPQVIVTDVEVRRYGDLALSSLISASDGDGDPIVAYRFYDATADAASGNFTINGVVQPSNQIIDVSAAQLAQTRLQAQKAPDDLWVQVSDGYSWSTWKEFHLIPLNHAPEVMAADTQVRRYGDLALSSLISASDPDYDRIATYRFYDATADATSGHFTVNGVAQSSGQFIEVDGQQFAQTRFQAGTTADDLWVQVSDGITWSAWKEFHLIPRPNTDPSVLAADQSVGKNVTIAASALFSASDADGDTITRYHFADGTLDASSGHFVVNGVTQSAGQIIEVSAAQLSQTTFHTGTTADDLGVQVFDGTSWSPWKVFHLTPDAVGKTLDGTNAWGGTVAGTFGVDTATYANASFGVYVDLAREGGWVQGQTAGYPVEHLVSIENVTGATNAMNWMHGDDNDNVFTGGELGDYFESLGGNNTLDGRGGLDTATYQNEGAPIKVDLTVGKVYHGSGVDTVSNIEWFVGTNDVDTFIGDGKDNRFSAVLGNDTLKGNGGADWLDGSFGNDTIDGGTGNDIIIGGPGDDMLTGGSNADTFVYQNLLASHDRIVDFRSADGDRIDFTQIATIHSLADLAIADDRGGNAVIGYSGNTIELVGVHAATLTSHEFLFAL